MKNIYKALAAFQQEVPILHKDASGYGYTYTPLATIIEKITPILKKHGLGFYQGVENNAIKTVVYHVESAETIESITNMPTDDLNYVDSKNKKGEDVQKLLGFDGMNKAQAFGSLITYFRRYSLTSILGLVTDKDADARNKRIEDDKLPKLKGERLEKARLALERGEVTIEQIKEKFDVEGIKF